MKIPCDVMTDESKSEGLKLLLGIGEQSSVHLIPVLLDEIQHLQKQRCELHLLLKTALMDLTGVKAGRLTPVQLKAFLIECEACIGDWRT